MAKKPGAAKGAKPKAATPKRKGASRKRGQQAAAKEQLGTAEDISRVSGAGMGHNGHNPLQVADFIDRAQDIHAAMLDIDEQARRDKEPHKLEMKNLMGEVHDAGIKKKAFRAKLSELKKLEEARRARENLDEDQRDEFDAITAAHQKALGQLEDTPLGQASTRKLKEDHDVDDEVDDEEEDLDESLPPPPASAPTSAAYLAGRKARGDGETQDANPFTPGTQKYQDFMKGFSDALEQSVKEASRAEETVN